jgi:EAL domain-containing protein (putative c-di-GMP-specific phosphodiesterase class I)
MAAPAELEVSPAPPPPAADDAALLSRIIATQNEIASAALDPREVVGIVTRRAQDLTRSTGAVVEIVDGDEMVYWSASGSATAHVGLRFAAASSLSGLCVRQARALQCDDSETDPRVYREGCRRVGLRSMVVVPLFSRGRAVGVLKVLSTYPGAYDAADVRTLELMATLVAATLDHAIEHAAVVAELDARLQADRRAQDEDAATRVRVREAVDRAAVSIAYQPIADLHDGRVVGLEALSRFPGNPGQPPDRWFADAARVGLGLELELTAVRKAMGTLPRIPGDVYLAVNVSPDAATSRALRELVLAGEPGRVVLEITEHAGVEDYGALSERLGELRRAGVRLAIDDAGAGFASLRHILRLAPEIIKLDVSLTRKIDSQPRQQTLASALVTFATGTAAAIVAEGIETPSELAVLKELGVRLGQGFLLGHPGALPETYRIGRISGR